jgi:transposase
MPLYCGIDLHSTSSYLLILDEKDRVVRGRKLPNRLEVFVGELEPYGEEVSGIAVESTFNWYWLVDGLMEAGYRVHLVNTAAVKQYEGLKYADDRHDARWLAHLLRLGILPTGFIYPKEERPVRDLLRKRGHLVRQRTANLLSLQNLWIRNTGELVRGNALKKLTSRDLAERIDNPELRMAMASTLAVIDTLNTQIDRLEKVIRRHAKRKSDYRLLLSVSGVGEILALTILYETGDIRRFPAVGNYASYCRCVDSRRLSHGKKKGEGNRRNGNRYLSWAFVEAANFAVRFEPRARRFFERKRAKKNRALAIRALANKLARASYFVMRDQKPFKPALLFR